MPFPTGPHLSVGTICERVLEEKDGAITLVRLIDRIVQQAIGTGIPTEMPPLTHQFALVIGLRATRP